MDKIIVIGENAGKRADKFLSGEFFSISRAEIVRQIKDGKILVNGKSIKPSYELNQGDVVDVNFFLEKGKLEGNIELEIKVIFENENILVLDKPAGIQMHPSATEKKNTLANWLIAKYPKISTVHDESADGYLRPGIVHRLDKDTSGLVVVAKNKESLMELKELFAQRKIIKKYLALLYGNLSEKKGVIEKPIARSTNFKRQKIAVGRIKGKARNAITEFRVLESYEGFDLVQAQPKTGRMHQIRIHFFSLGYPIVGDLKYVSKKYKKLELKNIPRQLLHARELKFELFGDDFEFISEIPADFYQFLTNID